MKSEIFTPAVKQVRVALPCGVVNVHEGSADAIGLSLAPRDPSDHEAQDLIDRATVELVQGCLVVKVPPGRSNTSHFSGVVVGNYGSMTIQSGNGQVIVNGQILGGNSGIEILLAVPRGTDLRVEGQATDVSASAPLGDVRLDLQSGRATILRAIRVQAQITSGELDVSAVEDIDASATSGSIRVQSVHGRARLDCTSGSIDLHACTDNVRARVTSGTIRATAAEGVRLDRDDFRATSGHVRVG